MSMNLSLATSLASTHAISAAALEAAPQSSAGGSVTATTSDAGDLYCPTPWHPPIPHQIGSQLDQVALNPQPLPPAEHGGGLKSAYADGDWCGTVPHKLPPFPPPPAPWADLAGMAMGRG